MSLISRVLLFLQILPYWTQSSRMCVQDIRWWLWGVRSCGPIPRVWQTSAGTAMGISSACPCQTWRRRQSSNSSWNQTTMAHMSAESPILQEHQLAHLMSLVSENKLDNYFYHIHIHYIYLLRCHLSVMFCSLFLINRRLYSTTLQCGILLWHTQPSPDFERKQLFLQSAVDSERPWGRRPYHRLLD